MSRRLVTALFVAFFATLLLLPMWIVRYPPLLDYPDHLARSFIVAHLNDPAYRFRDLYFTEWGPYPYLGMDLSLIALERFLPVETAGRVFLSICVLGIPLAGWLFLREANPRHEQLSAWILLLSYQVFFLEGFLNFHFGTVLSLLALTVCLRYLKSSKPPWLLLMFVLFTIVYFTHLIVFGITGFIVLVYTLAEPIGWRRRFWCWAAFVPGVLLYWKSHIVAFNRGDVHFRTLPQKFFAARAALLHAYSMRLELVFFWVIVACVLAAWFRNRQFRWNLPWLIVELALFVLYLILPVSVGPTWAIDVRLVPMMFVLLLAVAQVGARQKPLAAVALLIFCISVMNIARNFVRLQNDIAPMVNAIRTLPRNARMLPIVDLDDSDDMLHRLYMHFWTYAIVERGTLAPYIFDFRGQTEVRVREEGYVPDAPEEVPPDWEQVRRNYDYVWLWDIDYAAQLQPYATQVYHSGRLQLWRMQR